MSWYLLPSGWPMYAVDGESIAQRLVAQGAQVIAEADVQDAIDAYYAGSGGPAQVDLGSALGGLFTGDGKIALGKLPDTAATDAEVATATSGLASTSYVDTQVAGRTTPADVTTAVGAAVTAATAGLASETYVDDAVAPVAARTPPANVIPGKIVTHDGTAPKWETLAEAGIVGSSDGILYGEDGRTYRLLSAVIRNNGSGWAFINDAGHEPTGFDTITVTSDRITLDHAFAGSQVSSFQVTADETFAAMGVRVGASVGVDSTDLFLYREPADRITDFVEYNGTSWVSANGVYSPSFAAGILTLTHESMGVDKHNGVALGNRGTAVAQLGTIGDTTLQVAFYTGSFGSLTNVTAPSGSSQCRVHVTRYGRRASVPAIDPATLSSGSGNFWLTGLIEV